MMRYRLLAITVALCMAGSSFAGAAFSVFHPGSYQTILESYHGRPFVLVFWSLDCTHCMKELAMLAEVQAQTDALRLVLVSTDAPQDQTELQRLIVQSGVSADAYWVFAEADSPRLRYEVDRQWYGELPRTYLFDAQHSRRAVSGALKRALLDEWLACCNHN